MINVIPLFCRHVIWISLQQLYTSERWRIWQKVYKMFFFRKIFSYAIDFFLLICLSIHSLNKYLHRFGTVHIGCFDLSDIIAQNRHRFYQSKTIINVHASGTPIVYRVRYRQLFSSILQGSTRHNNNYNS